MIGYSITDLFIQRKVIASTDYQDKKLWNKGDLHQPVRFVIPVNPEVIITITFYSNYFIIYVSAIYLLIICVSLGYTYQDQVGHRILARGYTMMLTFV